MYIQQIKEVLINIPYYQLFEKVSKVYYKLANVSEAQQRKSRGEQRKSRGEQPFLLFSDRESCYNISYRKEVQDENTIF